MAYERRFSLAFLFLGLIGAFTSALAGPVHSLTEALRSFGRLGDWIDFKPDAAAALTLDRLSHDVSLLRQPTIASQFKAFMSRALLHKHFDGEHFDPGQTPA